MTTYRYKGISSSGASVEGVVKAFDQQDAIVKARENCRVLKALEPVSSGRVREFLNADVGALLWGGRIKPKYLALLCSQLAIELKSGLPLVSSLRLVAENENHKLLKKILEEVAEDVCAGNSLAESFALRGPGLPGTFVETVRAGEESGRLDEVFERLQQYYEDADTVSSKVVSAMIYPMLLICVAVLVVAIIMVFAVPVFAEAFAGQGRILPLPTRILILFSGFLADHWVLLTALTAAAALTVILYGRTDSGRHLYARIALTFPGVKLVYRMHAATQLCATLSTMLCAGLPLVKAGQITAAACGNILIRENLMSAVNGVIEGNRLADGLKNSPWLPPLLPEMVAVGEETGKLEETLKMVSRYYTREVEVAVKWALEILNPAITLILALLVVFILLSVYLPVFGMY